MSVLHRPGPVQRQIYSVGCTCIYIPNYQGDATALGTVLNVKVRTYLCYPSELRAERMQLGSPSRSHEGTKFVDRKELSFGRQTVKRVVSSFVPLEEHNRPFLEVGDVSQ